MSNCDYFITIETMGIAEYKDRGSLFIAMSFPIDTSKTFKEKLAWVKQEHPKANHHCFAYRLGIEENNFRISDAGEPAGTAGRPILGQIISREMTNILIVVIRYFGGTLLGVPGLINAYKSSTAMVLQVTPAVRKPVLIAYSLHFDYTIMHDIMVVIKKFSCEIWQQELQLFCTMHIGIPKNRLTETLMKLRDIKTLKLEKG